MDYKIFCDMDGVLVDFEKGYLDLTGIDLKGKHMDGPRFWDPINKKGYDFWINLGWMPDGKLLWNSISPYNPTILSAPSSKPESKVAKHDWVHKELGENVEIILRSARNKKEFAAPNHILIDDREDNIKDWIDSGGVGILHKSAIETLNELNNLGYNIKNKDNEF